MNLKNFSKIEGEKNYVTRSDITHKKYTSSNAFPVSGRLLGFFGDRLYKYNYIGTSLLNRRKKTMKSDLNLFKNVFKRAIFYTKNRNKVTLRTNTKQRNMDTPTESANRNICLGDITDEHLENISKELL